MTLLQCRSSLSSFTMFASPHVLYSFPSLRSHLTLQTLSSYQGCKNERSQIEATFGSEALPQYIRFILKTFFRLQIFLTQFFWVDGFGTCWCHRLSLCHKCFWTLTMMAADQVVAFRLEMSNLITLHSLL